VNASIIRGRSVFTHPRARNSWEEIRDGAVVQQDGVIVAVGRFSEIRAAHPALAVVGTADDVVLPGFVNAHHHLGLTPVQLGSPDMPLELWFATRLALRAVDPYLDTLYSAFEMIASGVTTVQHIHGWVPGGLAEVESAAEEVIRAYRDIGMRVSYCYALREQNHLVYEANEAFLARLPASLRPPLARHFARFRFSAADCLALFAELRARHGDNERVRIQLAPANLQWCSDETLTLFAEAAERHDATLHMHLLETAYQKEYAARRTGGSAVDHLGRLGLLGPRLTLGHGVWLDEADIALLAETGTHVCHNCSSNFRLRSGVAPLNRLAACGVNVAIGIDEAGINDDRDMLQEMRMVLRAHRTPGMDDCVPTIAQVLRMATEGGALTTPYGAHIGALLPGRAADMVLLDWNEIAFPYLDPGTPRLDAVLQRARTSAVKTVIVAGEIVYQDGRFTRVDRDEALGELARRLALPRSAEEEERRRLARSVLPHVRAFYEDYPPPPARPALRSAWSPQTRGRPRRQFIQERQ
jgi:cytosine/adenosine deaminase-related metal-dependent hydrolase